MEQCDDSRFISFSPITRAGAYGLAVSYLSLSHREMLRGEMKMSVAVSNTSTLFKISKIIFRPFLCLRLEFGTCFPKNWAFSEEPYVGKNCIIKSKERA